MSLPARPATPRVTSVVMLVVVLGLVLPAPAPAATGEAVGRPGSRGGPPSGWRLPLDGSLDVVRGFAPPVRRWERGHRGVDLGGSAGAVVRAAGAGTVTYAGVLAGVGVVTVAHPDGTRTTYQPVVATAAVGDRLPTGAVLGRLAVAGGHCLPAACLHWGHLRADVYLDPLLLVGAARARLLPVWAGRAGAAGAADGPSRGRVHAARPARSAPRAPPLPARPLSAQTVARGPVGAALLLVLGLAVLLRPRQQGRTRGHEGERGPQSSAGSSTASRA